MRDHLSRPARREALIHQLVADEVAMRVVYALGLALSSLDRHGAVGRHARLPARLLRQRRGPDEQRPLGRAQPQHEFMYGERVIVAIGSPHAATALHCAAEPQTVEHDAGRAVGAVAYATYPSAVAVRLLSLVRPNGKVPHRYGRCASAELLPPQPWGQGA